MTAIQKFVGLVLAASLMAFASPSFAQTSVEWVQVGGPFRVKAVTAGTASNPLCVHGLSCTCPGAGSYCGQHRNGTEVEFWKDGCNRPAITIRCVVRTAGAPTPGGAPQPGAVSIDTRRDYYEGRWDWKGIYKAQKDANNVSRIQFNSQTGAVYCYNRDCRNVTIAKGVGGDLTFTTDRKNYFELNASNPVQFSGRFWVDFKPPARSPDATIVFVRRP